MDGIRVDNWAEFESRVDAIRQGALDRSLPLLFRGQSDAAWSAQTTLDRVVGDGSKMVDYYHSISRRMPEVQSFTDERWDALRMVDLEDHFRAYDSTRRMLGSKMPGYEYLIFLRHHGFPSPLLDWSESPNIAAYFALRERPTADFAIYVLDEWPDNAKVGGSGEPGIFRGGPITLGHRRHFLQRSTYTMCAEFKDGRWVFADHERVFRDGEDIAEFRQDRIWKFVLPAAKRTALLAKLDAYNLTAYSLFGSAESLMETLKVREFDLSQRGSTNVG